MTDRVYLRFLKKTDCIRFSFYIAHLIYVYSVRRVFVQRLFIQGVFVQSISFNPIRLGWVRLD